MRKFCLRHSTCLINIRSAFLTSANSWCRIIKPSMLVASWLLSLRAFSSIGFVSCDVVRAGSAVTGAPDHPSGTILHPKATKHPRRGIVPCFLLCFPTKCGPWRPSVHTGGLWECVQWTIKAHKTLLPQFPLSFTAIQSSLLHGV